MGISSKADGQANDAPKSIPFGDFSAAATPFAGWNLLQSLSMVSPFLDLNLLAAEAAVHDSMVAAHLLLLAQHPALAVLARLDAAKAFATDFPDSSISAVADRYYTEVLLPYVELIRTPP